MSKMVHARNREELKAALAVLDAEEEQQRLPPGSELPRWKVVEKIERPQQSRRGTPGAALVLVCERDGRRREAVVSNATWNTTKVGDEVGLS